MANRQAEKQRRREERLAQEAAAAKASARRRRLQRVGGAVAVAVIAAAIIVAVTVGSGSGSSSARVRLGPAFGDMAKLPGAQTGKPPWPADTGVLRPRLQAIGLPALSAEGTVLHIHQHLDVFVDGRHVEVSAGIGIDPAGQFIAPLHTHDPTGVMHVESPTQQDFTLGQFFAVWGLPLSSRCVGGLCATARKPLRAWVDGKPVRADPTRIVLAAHQEIVLAYGKAPNPMPASYDFPAGE